LYGDGFKLSSNYLSLFGLLGHPTALQLKQLNL